MTVRLAAAVLALSAVPVNAALCADAQTTLTLDLDGQPLEAALVELSKQGHLQLVIPVGSLPARISAPLHGSMPLGIALERLLKDTGLTYKLVGDHTLAIVKSVERARHPSDPPGSLGASGATSSGTPNRDHRVDEGMNDNYEDGRDQLVKHRSLMLRIATYLGICVSASVTDPACAQNASAAEPPALQEIVVTAQRRAEREQDVPIAITTLSGSQLVNTQVDTVQGLARLTPSMVNFVTEGDPYALALSLRGVPVKSLNIGVDPTVGTYIDGVYLARTNGSGLGLVDMERAEVLSGPQGTLFGRNTIGGALNLTTQKPTEEFGGSITAEAGDYNTRNVLGVLNLPVSGDRLDARIVYDHQQHDGYSHNLFLGQRQNDLDSNYVRGSLLARLGENWTVHVSGDYGHYNAASQEVHVDYLSATAAVNALPLFGANPTDNLNRYVGGDIHNSYTPINPPIDASNYGAQGTITGDLGAVTVKSISAWRGMSSSTPTDQSGIPYAALELPLAFNDQHQFSQELQAYGKALDARLDWITGLYYFREKGISNFDDYALYPILKSGTFVQGAVVNANKGAFVQVSYKVAPKLRLTAGVRYSDDERSIVRQAYVTAAVTNARTALCYLSISYSYNAACVQPEQTVSYHYFPFTFGADYHVGDEALLYAKVSRGFHSGAFPVTGGADPDLYPPVHPEKLTSPEIGAKSEWFDHRLRVNGDVYYSDYSGVQATVTEPSAYGPQPLLKNWGDARIVGGELQMTAVLNRLQLGANLGWLHGEWTSGPLFTGVPGSIEPKQPYLFVPSFTSSLNGDYSLNLERIGALVLHGDYNYRSKIYYGPRAAADPASWAHEDVGGYGLVNLRIALTLAKVPLTVAFWAKNLTDKQYYSSKFDFIVPGLGYVAGYVGDPRTLGASISYRFGK
jgi:iron complex outermembrane recepter protein